MLAMNPHCGSEWAEVSRVKKASQELLRTWSVRSSEVVDWGKPGSNLKGGIDKSWERAHQEKRAENIMHQ